MDGSMYTERNKELNARSQVYELVLTGLMAALVMAATSFFRIPVPATNGYVHLGDAFVFLSVLILGRRNGTLAAATGSGLADLIGGYAHWVPWTFAIKGLMAFAFGTILIVINKRTGNAGSSETEMQRSTGLLTASAMALSSLIMIAGYFTAQRIIYGNFAAPLAALPGNIAQAAAGVLIAELASTALRKTAPQLIQK